MAALSRFRSRSRARKRLRSAKGAHHFKWKHGQLIGASGRYVVRRLFGEGSFGRVLGCADTRDGRMVAVKVVRGVKRYKEHAEAEAVVLREILRCDPGGQSFCVRLHDTFEQPRHHFCLVFEPLDVTIRDFLKDNCGRGLLVVDVHSVAGQLLQCLAFLHSIGLVHTDLKCRNVMLRDGRHDLVPFPRAASARETKQLRSCEIAVVDFGGAVFSAERQQRGPIGSRQFRAPEVVLGLPWDEKADLWSAGCLIAMTYLGVRPFNMEEDMEHLALVERFLVSKIPRVMAREALVCGRVPCGVAFRNSDARLAWPEHAPDEDAALRVEHLKPLCDQVCKRHKTFFALVEGLLQIDPKQRLSAIAATELPFICNEAELQE